MSLSVPRTVFYVLVSFLALRHLKELFLPFSRVMAVGFLLPQVLTAH